MLIGAHFSEYPGRHLHKIGESFVIFVELCNEIMVLTPVLTSPLPLPNPSDWVLRFLCEIALSPEPHNHVI